MQRCLVVKSLMISTVLLSRYEYKMAREYNWNVKNKATKGYEVRHLRKITRQGWAVCDRIISFRRVDGSGEV